MRLSKTAAASTIAACSSLSTGSAEALGGPVGGGSHPAMARSIYSLGSLVVVGFILSAALRSRLLGGVVLSLPVQQPHRNRNSRSRSNPSSRSTG